MTNPISLGIEDLDEVLDALRSGHFPCAKWRWLGLQLGLYEPRLEDIDEKYRGDPEKCLYGCLSAWLKRKDKVDEKGTPSWPVLAAALGTIGEAATASNIRKIS